ncbi:YdcF family protein [Rickettsiales bacterium]|nr:YdcF family protein [Rickettsiales bacterium]
MKIFKKRQFLYWLVMSSIILFCLWIGGLILFVNDIPRNVTNEDTKTDAIVILTGGHKRINTAISLLDQKKADKLFISGAGNGIDLNTLLIFSGKLPDSILTLIPKIELGYEAENTKGNATETAEWVKNNNFKTIRLVTANYHMPRSMMEFKNIMPDIKIISHPVFSDHVILDQWWTSGGTKQLLISEYNKYIASKIRSFIGS